MDRNLFLLPKKIGRLVALRKESVDRNLFRLSKKYRPSVVALRKESVDRNMLYDTSSLMKCQSLSARRAWIEIWVWCKTRALIPRRSPQGERG